MSSARTHKLPCGTRNFTKNKQSTVAAWVRAGLKVSARPHRRHARDDQLLARAHHHHLLSGPREGEALWSVVPIFVLATSPMHTCDVAGQEHLEPAWLRGPGGYEAGHGLRRLGRALRDLVARAAAAAVGHGLVAVAHAVVAGDGAAAVPAGGTLFPGWLRGRA